MLMHTQHIWSACSAFDFEPMALGLSFYSDFCWMLIYLLWSMPLWITLYSNLHLNANILFLWCAVYADGSICLDILQNQWSPIYDVAAILTSIQVHHTRNLLFLSSSGYLFSNICDFCLLQYYLTLQSISCYKVYVWDILHTGYVNSQHLNSSRW
jgi:hypothetical protein